MSRDGKEPDAIMLNSFEEALRHRGPDGSGRHVNSSVAMLQTRLAIIDLATGDQPLHAFRPSGDKVTLIANGEIFNYPELRDGLRECKFSTASDCEIPLHIYLRDGVQFAAQLRGMYAIAIHDPKKGRLILSRDPFGIKPLYYAETATAFAFASEAQALIRGGFVNAELDDSKACEMLQLQFTTGKTTPFKAIKRVLPGETLVVHSGRIIERQSISALPHYQLEYNDTRKSVLALDEAFEESVRSHQLSDVPYGMFLSGGVDSSALIAMMRRLNEKPVQAFTIGFDGSGDMPDERLHAARVAKSVGAIHTEVGFNKHDFWSLLPRVAAALDDPVADYAAVPTFKLAHFANQAGLKVILSGEGGDEILAGYGRYRRQARPWFFGGRRMWEKGILSGLGVLKDHGVGWRRGIQDVEDNLPVGMSPLQRAQALDCNDWLPNDLLTKIDRCLMAHGIEGRVPFVDRFFANFGFGLPDSCKVKGGQGKWILRKWLEQELPESEPYTKKRGFTVPVGEWIFVAGKRLGPLIAQQPGIQALCHKEKIATLFTTSGKRQSQAQWVLLFFALWHQHHILGRPVEGDTFDMLDC
mgnify:CR=1 FL=1